MQRETTENACRNTSASALNLPGVLDAGIALYDAQNVLHLEYVERRHKPVSPFDGLLLDSDTVTYRAVQNRQTVCVHDCDREAPQSLARTGDIEAVKAAPIIVADQSIGAVVITAAHRDALTIAHRTAVNALASELGTKLSYQTLDKRHTHLQQLYGALNASSHLLMGSVRSADKLYQQACQICIQNAGFAIAWIARPDDTGWFHTLAIDGPAQGLIDDMPVTTDPDIPEGNGSVGRAWRSGEAVYLQRPRAEQRYQHWHSAYDKHGIYGVAATPLKRNGRVDAVLAVGVREADYFGSEERPLFEEIGTDLSAALSRLEERIRTQITATAVQNAPSGVLVAEADTQRVRYSNIAMTTLTGYTRAELQCRTGLFFMPDDPTGETLPGFAACVRSGRTWQGLVWGRRDNQVWEASVEVRTITGPDRNPQLLALFGPRPEVPDARLRDPLTGLPNTESFQQTLASTIEPASNQGLVLIRIGIHDLALINGAYGRAGGNRVLVDLASRLRQALPMSTLVARLEGDNFAVLTRAVHRNTVHHVARRLLRRIEASVEQPFEIENSAVPVLLATGVVTAPEDGTEAQSLTSNAETALSRARANNVGSGVAPEDRPEATRDRLATAAQLRQVLKEGRGIHPWYQPKIDLQQGTLIGVEALARWQDETRGLVSPGQFMPLAEALGLGRKLDRTMCNAVLHDIARWHQRAMASKPVAINLSASQIADRDLPRQLLDDLTSHDVPPSLLHVEITEHDVITDIDAARAVLQALEASGIEVVLDDFGTGYSSLSILRDLPLSKLKLDKSFVDRLADDARSFRVAQMAIDLAHDLDVKVVAEGVEEQEQADILRRLYCDYAQGFFYARPMPASDLETGWL